MKAVTTKPRSASTGGEQSFLSECTLSLDEAHYDDKFRYLMFHIGDAVYDQVRIPVLNGFNRDRREAMAERLSAAWNACKGWSNEELERLDGQLFKAVSSKSKGQFRLEQRIDTLSEKVAFMVDLLRQIEGTDSPVTCKLIARKAIEIAEAA